MSGHCCDPDSGRQRYDRRYRRVLWAVLLINAVMFMAEIVAGLMAGSASLQADALDFLADTANYGISLWVAGLGIVHRARAAVAKGSTMGLFGLWVLIAIPRRYHDCSHNSAVSVERRPVPRWVLS